MRFQRLHRVCLISNIYNNLGNLLFAQKVTQVDSIDRVLTQFWHSEKTVVRPPALPAGGPSVLGREWSILTAKRHRTLAVSDIARCSRNVYNYSY